MAKGKMVYVPEEVLNELKNIKTEEQIKRNAEAFNRMVNNSRLGRQKKKKNYDNLGVF